MLFILFVSLIVVSEVELHEPHKAITKCPRQCACNAEYMADLPLMKWLTIPMNKHWQNNNSFGENQVWDDNEDIQLDDNQLLNVAFCVFQADAKSIEHDEFAPHIEALTILHGPDSTNRTIEYELSSFRELLTLDIQGYQKNSSIENYPEIFLNYSALLELQQLQYVNIQNVRLVPNPNSKNKDIPKSAYDYLRSLQLRQSLKETSKLSGKLTFVIPDEPEILPYNEFKMRNSVISTFSHLNNLKFLRLYQCKLASITWEMFEGLEKLETLSLEGNDIFNIPEFAFYGMPNLKILILSNNKLTDIQSESFAGLFNLEHLDLSRNYLRHLSETTFAPLPKLYSLDIRDNPIVTIHASTFEVTNMTRVLLVSNKNNALSLHNNALNGLNELEKLIITGLNVSTLQKSLLAGAPKLNYLKLEGKLEYIDFDAFTGSLLLETLILKNCSLRSISMDAFYGLARLKVLDLSDNQLQTLPSGIFDRLNSLDELILTSNKFTSLPINVFAKLTNVKMIRLDENPWHCSCKLLHWPSHIINKNKQVRMMKRCDYRFDKSPCVSEPEQYYAYDPHVSPKCATPTIYQGWNAYNVVHKKLNCRKATKQSKSRKNNSQEIADQEKSSDKDHSSVNNEDNNLMAREEDKVPSKNEHKSQILANNENMIRKT